MGHKQSYLALIITLGLLMVFLASGSASGQDVAWQEYADPYWAFEIAYPTGWTLQNLPYRDFGFRISSPDLEADPLGRPLQGAYLSVLITPMSQDQWESFKSQIHTSSQTTSVQEIEISGMPGTQVSGIRQDGYPFVDRTLFANQHFYHFSYVMADENDSAFFDTGQRMLASIALLGTPAPYPLPDYEALGIDLQDFSFPSVKHAFPAGEGRIINGYNDGNWHRGGDLYAVDLCEGSDCSKGDVGDTVLAPTNIKLDWSVGEDFHIFEIANNGTNKLCMSLGHFDLKEEVVQAERGQAVGTLLPYDPIAHIHMGLWTVPANKKCATNEKNTRVAVPYTGNYKLDDVEYPTDTDWSDPVGVVSTNSYCPHNAQEVILYKDAVWSCGGEGEGSGYVRVAVDPSAPVDVSVPDGFGASSISIPPGYHVYLYERDGASIAQLRYRSDYTFTNNRFLSFAWHWPFVEFREMNDRVGRLKIECTTCGSIAAQGGSSPSGSCPPNDPPYAPTLQSPGNGYIAHNYLAPTVCWNNQEDPNGDELEFQVQILGSAASANSGWINGTCWRPGQLDRQYYDYQWRVKARDPRGAESDWSATWHFSIAPPNQPPSISFGEANNNPFPSGRIDSRERDWTFEGTAGDPEGQLSRVEWRCSGDNCGNGETLTSGSSWSLSRSNLAGRNEIYFVAYDSLGQKAVSRHLDLRIDRAAPATSASLNGEGNSHNWPTWYRRSVRVDLSATDRGTGRALSGVDEIVYRLDGGSWQTSGGNTFAHTFHSDGVHTIEYYARDRVGNQESPHSITIRIDQAPPSPPSGIVETHGVPHNAWQKDYNIPTFTWSASTDATSGIWGYQLYFDENPNGTAHHNFKAGDPREWTPRPGGVHTGVYYLRGRTRDQAGNWSAWTNLFTFRYDGTPPENPGDVTHAAGISSTLWQRQTNTADMTWSEPHDEGSGVKGYYVYWGANPAGTSSDLITTNHFQDGTPLCAGDAVCTGYLRLRSVDNVDNLANEWSTGFVLRYDNVPPTVDFTINGGMATTNQTRVILTISASDEGSGVDAMRLSNDGLDWSPWEVYTTTRSWMIPPISKQSWPVYVQVRDGVELVSQVVSHTIYLDVNREQPRSSNFRLLDYTVSAGAGAQASTTYTGRGTTGQLADTAIVSSTHYQVLWGYEAGSQAIPLPTPPPPGPPPTPEPPLACEAPYIQINGDDAFTSAPTVTLNLCAPHAAEMMVSNDISFAGAVWEPYTTTKSWTLPIAGLQTSARHVYATFKDTEGLVYETYFDDVIYDSTAPGLAIAFDDSVLLDGGQSYEQHVTAPLAAPLSASGTITLYLGGDEDNSGFAEVQVGDTPDLSGAAWEPYAPVILYTPPGEDGMKTVYVRVRDSAGNISPVVAASFAHDTQPPRGGITFGQRVVGADAITTTLYFGAGDDLTGLSDMRVSPDATFTDTSWQPYTTSLVVPLSTTLSNQYSLYVQFRDMVGNVSKSYSDTLQIDDESPIVYVDVAPGDTLTRTVTVYAYDESSWVANWYLSNDPLMLEGVISLPNTTAIAWNFDQSRVAWVQVEDKVGNVSEPYPIYAREMERSRVYLPLIMQQ